MSIAGFDSSHLNHLTCFRVESSPTSQPWICSSMREELCHNLEYLSCQERQVIYSSLCTAPTCTSPRAQMVSLGKKCKCRIDTLVWGASIRRETLLDFDPPDCLGSNLYLRGKCLEVGMVWQQVTVLAQRARHGYPHSSRITIGKSPQDSRCTKSCLTAPAEGL